MRRWLILPDAVSAASLSLFQPLRRQEMIDRKDKIEQAAQGIEGTESLLWAAAWFIAGYILVPGIIIALISLAKLAIQTWNTT